MRAAGFFWKCQQRLLGCMSRCAAALQSGGKRIRPFCCYPVLWWVSGRGDWRVSALPAAVVGGGFSIILRCCTNGVIMDCSDLRHADTCRPCIRSGGVMRRYSQAMHSQHWPLGSFSSTQTIYKVLATFNWLAMAVCRGQHYDMEFEA